MVELPPLRHGSGRNREKLVSSDAGLLFYDADQRSMHMQLEPGAEVSVCFETGDTRKPLFLDPRTSVTA